MGLHIKLLKVVHKLFGGPVRLPLLHWVVLPNTWTLTEKVADILIGDGLHAFTFSRPRIANPEALCRCSWIAVSISPDHGSCWLGLVGAVVHEHLDGPRMVTAALSHFALLPIILASLLLDKTRVLMTNRGMG